MPARGLGRLLVVALTFALPPSVADAQSPMAALERARGRAVLDTSVVEAFGAAAKVRVVAYYAAERGDLPGAHARAEAARARLARRGAGTRASLRRVPAMAAEVDAAQLAELLDDPHVARVSLDARFQLQLAEGVPLVNLDTLHAGGLTGEGALVAIVDSGIDLGHADLADAVVAERCFCDTGFVGGLGCCPNGLAEQSGAGAAEDDNGHGTNVAGVLTSAAAESPVGGAPDAELVVIKVVGPDNSGLVSDLLAGLDWLLVNWPEVVAVNLSLGFGPYAGECDDADANTMAFAALADQLSAAGVLVVGGAGNTGSGSSMLAPACLANAVSVGAVWDADVGSQTKFGCTDATTAPDQVACWSSSNALTDVFAPGALTLTSSLGNGTRTVAGSSFSTPLVTACAAVLAMGHPEASVETLRTALGRSPHQVVDVTNGLSFPRLDCVAAQRFLSPTVPGAGPAGLAALVLLLAGSVWWWALAPR